MKETSSASFSRTKPPGTRQLPPLVPGAVSPPSERVYVLPAECKKIPK
jgi:hypothetical protein